MSNMENVKEKLAVMFAALGGLASLSFVVIASIAIYDAAPLAGIIFTSIWVSLVGLLLTLT